MAEESDPATVRPSGSRSPGESALMPTFNDCPQCRAPAEVLSRWTFESTDGPVEHVKMLCVLGHWFAMPTWMLTSTPG